MSRVAATTKQGRDKRLRFSGLLAVASSAVTQSIHWLKRLALLR